MKSPLEKALNPNSFREQSHKLVDMLADYLENIQTEMHQPVLKWQPPEKAVKKWEDRLNEESKSQEDFFRDLIEDSIHVHHPHFMGHQLSPIAPLAATASLLTDFLNNGTGIYEMGPPGSMMEFTVIREVAKAMGLPTDSGGFLTSGGTLANLTALLAARSFKAEKNVWKEGESGDLALMVAEQAHYSVDRAVRIMGWGESGIIKIPVNDNFEMRTDLLEQYYEKAKAEGKRVIAVVGSACSTATGAFDDLEAIADFCENNNLWLHVDGAHGGALCFSEKYKHLLNGIHRADSVIMDFHKLLLTPVTTTAVVFRDKKLSYQTFAQKASYLFNKTAEEEWFNLALRTFECTKPSLAIPVYSLFYSYGTSLFDDFVTKVCDNGRSLAKLINQRDNFELAHDPQCNIVCFRYVKEGKTTSELDELNRQIRKTILKTGNFYIVQTVLNGKQYLRTTLGSPMTEDKHLSLLLDEIEIIGNRIQ